MSVMLTDPVCGGYHLAARYGSGLFMTGNLLVVVVLACQLRYLYEFLLSAVILEFSDRRAPVLNHKVVGWQSCISWFIWTWEGIKQRKSSWDYKHILYILITSLHHGLPRDWNQNLFRLLDDLPTEFQSLSIPCSESDILASSMSFLVWF